jgi:hypothetical protein
LTKPTRDQPGDIEMRSIRRLIVVAGTIGALTFLVPSVSASSPLGEVHLTKTCPTWTGEIGSTCTVQTASGPIPVGTVATYYGPIFGPVVSSAVILTTPSGATATGHCTLVWRPELSGDDGFGTCTFVGGTGSLAGFHANLKITDHPDTLVTNWDGTYFFAPAD